MESEPRRTSVFEYLYENHFYLSFNNLWLRERCVERILRRNYPKRASTMKPRDPKIIEHLNWALKNELTAINQYFLHSRMLKDWGMGDLGEHEYKESIDEMQHADRLIERILFLDGLPNLQELGKLLIGENVEEILKCDLALEMAAMPVLREAVAYSESVSDYVSREIFEAILESEEEHVDWLETQIELIGKTGIRNYIQSAM